MGHLQGLVLDPHERIKTLLIEPLLIVLHQDLGEGLDPPQRSLQVMGDNVVELLQPLIALLQALLLLPQGRL